MSKTFDIEIKVTEVWSVELNQDDVDEFRKKNYKSEFWGSRCEHLSDLEIAQQIANEDYYDLGHVIDTDIEMLHFRHPDYETL